MKIILAILLLISFTSYAQEEEAPPQQAVEAVKQKTNPKVLDFDAEIIEGERKAPNLFLQLHVDNPDLDAVLFQRSNFNDFHETEKNRRPLYRTQK